LGGAEADCFTQKPSFPEGLAKSGQGEWCANVDLILGHAAVPMDQTRVWFDLSKIADDVRIKEVQERA
jgi:hypothetical protein